MKKLLLTLSLIIIVFCTYAQVVAYKPVRAYYKSKETLWEWRQSDIDYDEMPVIKIYFNNSSDYLSRVDRVTISNDFNDDFTFPYKGDVSGTGIIYNVKDNQGKKIKVFFDFQYMDEGYFDLVFKYINVEYAYRLLKNKD
jgi:hypothetical protein